MAKYSLIIFLTLLYIGIYANNRKMPKLILNPSAKIENHTLSNLYPSMLEISYDSKYSKNMLYTVGEKIYKINKETVEKYANLEALPYAFEFTANLKNALQNKKYNEIITVAVINGSMDEHYNFYLNALEVAENNKNIGFLDINTQFDFSFSLEIYRRHCPTIFEYNPMTDELFLTYAKFTGNKTQDTPQITELFSDLKQAKYKPIKLGIWNMYTKFVNIWYIYNNFHFMFNYLVGAIAIVFIIVLLIFEKSIMRAMQPHKRPPIKTEDHKKAS